MSEQQTTAERFPHLAGSIDYDAFRAAMDALDASYAHIDEYREEIDEGLDYFALQRALADRLPDLPEPVRTWVREWADIQDDED